MIKEPESSPQVEPTSVDSLSRGMVKELITLIADTLTNSPLSPLASIQ